MAGFLVVTGKSRDWGEGYRAGGGGGQGCRREGWAPGLGSVLTGSATISPWSAVSSTRFALRCLQGCNCEGPPLFPFCLRQLGSWPG